MPKKKVTIENLATMVKKGFDETQKDINNVRGEIKDTRSELKDDMKTLRQEMKDGFKKIDERFKYTNSRLDVIERDIKGFVSRDEFDDVLSRLRLVEKTLGIKA